ncbi:hypothetical protein AMECASPLE_021605 [Ameca splendens]|uniref:Uncharacterized protein n=1 Tax=Ameca splendens TaxID=208324 RepID=A0ABV0XGL4_9TELE
MSFSITTIVPLNKIFVLILPLVLVLILVVFCFIRDRVADSVETSRLPSLQAPLGGAQGTPSPPERHSPSSMSWAISWASSQWDVPGTPPEGVQCQATASRSD